MTFNLLNRFCFIPYFSFKSRYNSKFRLATEQITIVVLAIYFSMANSLRTVSFQSGHSLKILEIRTGFHFVYISRFLWVLKCVSLQIFKLTSLIRLIMLPNYYNIRIDGLSKVYSAAPNTGHLEFWMLCNFFMLNSIFHQFAIYFIL